MRKVSCPRHSNYLCKVILFPKFQPLWGILSLWIKSYYYSLLLPLHRALSHFVLKRTWSVHPLGKKRIGKSTKTEDVGHRDSVMFSRTRQHCSLSMLTARMGTGRSQDHTYPYRLFTPASPKPWLSHLMWFTLRVHPQSFPGAHSAPGSLDLNCFTLHQLKDPEPHFSRSPFLAALAWRVK